MVETAVETKKAKRRKSRRDADVMWYMVTDVLVKSPLSTNAELRKAVREAYNVECPEWLIMEARFVYKKKAESGDVPKPGGYVSVSFMQGMFSRMQRIDRTRFLDWAQREHRSA